MLKLLLLEIITTGLLAYLIGSIPSGLIISKRFYNIDLREHGSKNIGTSNAYRTLGKKPAFVIFLADVSKGIAGVFIGQFLCPEIPWVFVFGGVMSMIGHNWSIYLKFKGGKGVATGLGVLLMLSPKVTSAVFLIWLLVILTTRYASLASITAAVCVPWLMWFWHEKIEFFYFALLAALFVLVRHRANIKRLLTGSEPKIKAGNLKVK